MLLHTQEKGEPQEGHKDKGDTNKATGSGNCFHNSTVDILSGGKKYQCQIQKSLLLIPISMQLFLMLRLFYCQVMQYLHMQSPSLLLQFSLCPHTLTGRIS